MNNQISIQKTNNNQIREAIYINPLIAYTISIPQPETLSISKMTPYEISAYPAIIGNLTGLSIKNVTPKFKMGRIISFDAVPRAQPDPIIIYSPIGDLSLYYNVWSDVMINGVGNWFSHNRKIKKYDDAIKIFVESSFQLAIPEFVFAVIEMLKFKNDIILNQEV